MTRAPYLLAARRRETRLHGWLHTWLSSRRTRDAHSAGSLEAIFPKVVSSDLPSHSFQSSNLGGIEMARYFELRLPLSSVGHGAMTSEGLEHLRGAGTFEIDALRLPGRGQSRHAQHVAVWRRRPWPLTFSILTYGSDNLSFFAVRYCGDLPLRKHAAKILTPPLRFLREDR